jgi:hypothetical protein
MLGLTTLVCELTKDELVVLTQEVLWLISEIAKEEASWFYACEHLTDDLYHLMDKSHYDRRDPALCGNRPLLRVQVAEESILRGWFLLPLGKEEELDEQRVCPACLALWKAQQTGEIHDTSSNHLARKEQL